MHWGEISSERIVQLCLSNAPRNRLYRHPLFRRLYLVFFLLFTLIILLPLWTLLYIPRRNRPRQAWTLQRCLRVRWSRRLCALVARCEIDYLGRDLNLDLDPLKLSHSHPLTIPPAPEKYLIGHPAKALVRIKTSEWKLHLIHPRPSFGRWARDQCQSFGFEPVKAFWFTGVKESPDEPMKPRQPDDPVILHFHGGGYLCGTAAETDLTSSICKALVAHTAIHHVISIDYRLAPTAPWPLPLLDAISAYRYLIEEGVEDIVLAGDSAGGHLALALTRWLRDDGWRVGLKMPKALVLMSPWCDVGFSNSWGDEGYSYNTDSDTIDDTFGPFATSLLLRGLPAEMMHTSEYLSPSSYLLKEEHIFDQFPDTFIVYGGAERLGLSIKLLWKRLRGSRTANDCLLETPDSVHDFLIFPWQAEEAAGVYEKLDEWLRDVLAEETGPEIPLAETIVQRRKKRRASLKLEKSPVMRPLRKDSGVISMITDFQGEGRSMVDLPPLDLDSSANSAKEWLTPFTSQQEKGDWDWEGDNWYDGHDSE